jgi:hypothetical protein
VFGSLIPVTSPVPEPEPAAFPGYQPAVLEVAEAEVAPAPTPFPVPGVAELAESVLVPVTPAPLPAAAEPGSGRIRVPTFANPDDSTFVGPGRGSTAWVVAMAIVTLAVAVGAVVAGLMDLKSLPGTIPLLAACVLFTRYLWRHHRDGVYVNAAGISGVETTTVAVPWAEIERVGVLHIGTPRAQTGVWETEVDTQLILGFNLADGVTRPDLKEFALAPGLPYGYGIPFFPIAFAPGNTWLGRITDSAVEALNRHAEATSDGIVTVRLDKDGQPLR